MSYRDYVSKVGFSGVGCSMCGKETTNPSYFYSMKKWGFPYCHACGTTIESTEKAEDQLSTSLEAKEPEILPAAGISTLTRDGQDREPAAGRDEG